MSYGLHWFRRDLRLQGNLALQWNSREHGGKVLGVFFFDSAFLSRPDFSHPRFAFFLDTLLSLKAEMIEAGGDLLVLDRRPAQGFADLLSTLEKGSQGKPAAVTFSRDYEPFARERDAQVTRLLEEDFRVRVHTERDHLLIEPGEICKEGDSSFYQVYSPFARRWFEKLRSDEVRERLSAGLFKKPRLAAKWPDYLGRNQAFSDQLEKFRLTNFKKVTIPIPAAGNEAAKRCLREFRPKLECYAQNRDFPAQNATSRASIFLKNGSLTSAQLIASLGLENALFRSEGGPARFLKEIAWREFYYHILWHRPRVENEAFLAKYRDLSWENREDRFEAWKQGRTGFPIVDAGMRELNQTGWMHNRVRMIVASFLTKDLLIDWRWGERYFMEKLLDGDLAPNNGGWQWAASTGCDPQPYFRVFNPTLQSLKFDPEGKYIKQWVPERAHLHGKALHEPTDPIVDHSSQKERAIRMYRVVTSSRR